MRVFYNGRSESVQQSQPASDLRTGVEYRVKEVKMVDGQENFVLKDMPEGIGYSANWFKVLPVYLATSSKLPVVGENLKNFTMVGRASLTNEETTFSEEKVKKIKYLGGAVYEVHLKYKTLILEVF